MTATEGLPKIENGKKVENIEISVDACAQLSGQVYEVIKALRDVYQLSGLRKLSYVDTFQGFREKSDGTTPETLFAFGEPHSRYGRFLRDNKQWATITETAECKLFSQTLGTEILPAMTAPVIHAVEEISGKIREETFKSLESRDQKTLSGKYISSPDDIEIALHYHKPRKDLDVERRQIVNPLIDDAVVKVMLQWKQIVHDNPVLRQSSENDKKGMLLKLIAATQESKAIASALLYSSKPDLAAEMGEIPPLVKHSASTPSLQTLRDSAHQFGHLKFPEGKDIWSQPEVQQAIRYTELWPWSRKPYMHDHAHDRLRVAHRNTADRAAVSYFLSDLPKKPAAGDTLYILVTHDGPLINDFIKFITGINKGETKIKDSTEKGVGRQKRTVYSAVPENEYEKRQLPHVPVEHQSYSAILTGREFLTFVEREKTRVLKKAPMTHELSEAMDTLNQSLESLKDAVVRDRQHYGITHGGTFAQRIRQTVANAPKVQGV